jgi:poly-gamma-glutamate capsule biosynthesis protein CapA/YwtB (metallophosphatase superfamily)
MENLKENTSAKANLIIAGDLCPIGRNEPLYMGGKITKIYNDLLPHLLESDLNVANLECPLTNESTPLVKAGPALKANEECINGLKAIPNTLLCLANNHILDHGSKGLIKTMELCKEAKIPYFGAGMNDEEAAKPVIQSINGHRIAFWAVAEHEFSITDHDQPGANALDPISFIRFVRKYKDSYDFLIILIHGGKELYPYPTPDLQKASRFFAEEGASAVICQHTHIPSCMEVYNDVPVFYGQGNFIFDKSSHYKHWNEGFLIRLIFEKETTVSYELIPYTQSKEKAGAFLMDEKDSKDLLDKFNERTKKVVDSQFVRREWEKECLNDQPKILKRLKSFNRFFQIIDRRFNLEKILFNKGRIPSLYAYIMCETHRARVHVILKNLMK